MADPLSGYTKTSFTAEGKTRDVYRTGTGPAVVVISEIPGITPLVADFGRKVATTGCTAVLPHLFGEPGKPPSAAYGMRGVDLGLHFPRVRHAGDAPGQPGHDLVAGAGGPGPPGLRRPRAWA